MFALQFCNTSFSKAGTASPTVAAGWAAFGIHGQLLLLRARTSHETISASQVAAANAAEFAAKTAAVVRSA